MSNPGEVPAALPRETGTEPSAAPGAAPLPRAARAALAPLAGFALLAASNAIAIAAAVPWPAGGLRVRLLHHVFDAASVLGLGVLAALAVGLWAALPRAPRWAGLLVYWLVSVALVHEMLGRDLRRQAVVALGGRVEGPLFALYVALSGLVIPVLHAAGAALSRRPVARALALVVALAAVVTDHVILRDDYHGLHGAIAWAAATLAGTAGAPYVEALAARVRAAGWGAAAAGVVLCAGLLGLAVPPPNAVRLELFREPCAVGAWALAATSWSSPEPAPGAAGAPDSPWWRERRGLAPVPPTDPPLQPGPAPVVVLITVDAVRADAIAAPANERMFPTWTELKRTGAYFTHAVSPGSQTAVSLSTLFSGRYFSQLVWEMHGKGATRFSYPAYDPAERFPELLSAAGVATASYCGVNFLAGEYGVLRGIKEENRVVDGRAHAMAHAVIDPLLKRLERAGDGPLFLYAHLMEPHAPYDRGARHGTDRERYLSEIAIADQHLGRVLGVLKRRFAGRGYLIVSSDHGEAFGEHGTRQHTKTLYEELVRIPLLVWGPRVVSRPIEQPVGLIDVGPTVLDLFGVATPAEFMGQSLVPLLSGREVALTRPLLAEGRLRRALYRGGLKVIDDPRQKVVEVFDLERDPGETVNLFDTDRGRADPALAALRAFFAVHRAWKPGYVPVYKP